MNKSSVQVQIKVKLPPEKVFDIFTNHASYRKVPLVLNTKLVQAGDPYPSNGINAIREINFIGGSLKEIVTDMQYPFYWDYLFFKWPLPIPHLGGRIQFEEIEHGTLVTWSSSYDAGRLPKFVLKTIDSMTKGFLLYASKALSKIAFKEAQKT